MHYKIKTRGRRESRDLCYHHFTIATTSKKSLQICKDMQIHISGSFDSLGFEVFL